MYIARCLTAGSGDVQPGIDDPGYDADDEKSTDSLSLEDPSGQLTKSGSEQQGRGLERGGSWSATCTYSAKPGYKRCDTSHV